ncbi:RING-H2 finger protein ATL2 [Lycium ferocissimum]|uniref:RING-H2 finger protein ATL2 n=1 Tax=Lycium ferocissimum TaxID=112874 RepID=UPI0028168890|nr:RING-H2 finger protein ATL2 [Lycium ferocissimum]
MDEDEYSSSTLPTCCDPPHYAFSGKLMFISVLIFFIVCLLIAFFHLYINRFRHRRNHHRNLDLPVKVPVSQGLDPSVIKALPVFVYKVECYQSLVECPVCLEGFEDGEKGRVLPKCSHCFHCECIDMWFQSHDSCPVCRAPVQPLVKLNEVKENSSELGREGEVVIMVHDSN